MKKPRKLTAKRLDHSKPESWQGITFNPIPRYILLGSGDTFWEGDEFLNPNAGMTEWQHVAGLVGQEVIPEMGVLVRRTFQKDAEYRTLK